MAKVFDASSSAVINALAPYLTERIPTATADNLNEVSKIILSSADLQNQFLNVLVNRICRVIITSRLYENPLRSFKKGTEKYGDIIEEIFVNIANAHEYDPLIAESEVYKREIPDVGAVFHKMNSRLFYKTTIQQEDLAKAFVSESGMRSLIAKIVDSLYSGANYDEFLSMKNILSVSKEGFAYIKTDAPSDTTAKNILTNIRSASNLLEFMSDEYNAVGVKNFTPKANQVLMIRADVDAIIDVNALAAVFNLDKAEFQTRKIMVDNFGEGNDDVYAILCDDEFLQVVNNLDKFTEQYNAQGDYWNYFWHVWRTYAASPFSNVIAFTSGTIVQATGVTITTANGTYPKGTNLQMTATIAPTTATAKGVRWTLEGAEADTYISATGMVHLGKGQTTNLTIKATVISKPTLVATKVWNPTTGALSSGT